MTAASCVAFDVTGELVLAWFPDLPSTTRLANVSLRLDDRPLPAPYTLFACGRSETPDCGVAVICRRPPDRGAITARGPDGTTCRVALDALPDMADLCVRLTAAARMEVLRQLLETASTLLRANGSELAAACRRWLDALDTPAPAVSGCFSLGDGIDLLAVSVPGGSGKAGGYRLTDGGVQRERAPIGDVGTLQLWIVGGPRAPGDRLVGVQAGGDVWQIRLDVLRARPPAVLLRYLETLDQRTAAGIVGALDRWRAVSPDIGPVPADLVEDCRVLFGGVAIAGRKGRALQYGIDGADPIPGGAVLVRGWLFDPYRRIVRVDVVDAAGTRMPLPMLWPVANDRAATVWKGAGLDEPVRPGFVSYADGGVDGPWRVDLILKGGAVVELPVPAAEPDPGRARDAILASLPPRGEVDGAVIEALAPAVERLHAVHMRRYPAGSRVRSRFSIGRPCRDPRVSVVIPLYRNLNFLGFQQAAFATDPAFANAELIYVLDSPEQIEFLEGRLRGEHLIYGLPVTVVEHTANLGFAAAVNTGAAVARGRDLVLLNSDVVPERPGWLDPLLSALDRPGIGASGPQLLYLDDSLQFAGMYFEKDADGCWFNRHIAKGYARGYPAANRPREVPALTGACLAVRRTVFEELGGFDEGFVIGDFEDSDFSLRIRRAGMTCWYEPGAVLYHIERQSVDRHKAHGGSAATMVNRWRQQRLWGDAIEALMADAPARWGVPASLVPEIERLP